MPRARLHITVTPGAKRSEIVAGPGQELRIRVAVSPTEGKANKALIAYLAGDLGVPRSFVSIVRGAGSRHKVVEIDGLTQEEALAKLHPLM